jgi:thiamine thiazole synthase
MAPSAVSPVQQHAFAAKKALGAAVGEGGAAPLSKALTDIMGNWDKFSFAPIRESTVSRAMTRRCRCLLPLHSAPFSDPSRGKQAVN